MADEWAPFANRDSHAWKNNPMTKNTGALRVVLHDTENQVGTNPQSIANWMANNGAKLSGGYHLLLPLNDAHKPLQLRPANVAAGSLKNNGTLARSPNKEGTRLIAISLICYAKDDHATKSLGPWWPQVLAWVRSLGVPDTIIGGRLPPGSGGLNKIPLNEWYSGVSGWCFHATAPNPDSAHWDCGRVDQNILFARTDVPPVQPPIQPPVDTGGTYSLAFDGGAAMTLRYLKRVDPMMKGGDVKSLQGTLNLKGFNAGTADGVFGNNTKSAVQRAQAAMGIAQDGIVGPTTMERLWER